MPGDPASVEIVNEDEDEGEIEQCQCPNPSLERGYREVPPTRRPTEVFKFRIGGHTHYIRIGRYDDGRICEVFIQTAKYGQTLRGYAESLATMISLFLQVGGTSRDAARMLRHASFEPCGAIINAPLGIEYASSLPDALAQLLEVLDAKG